ncbi:MAG: T9SS type A sorting domain-containing protein [Sphingobacteriaceae bacterium]|nr:T9SS type A sorting domain-containing protein [Sphingobacteriaceae bacterium]
MRKIYFLLLLSFGVQVLSAQSVTDAAVPLNAAVQVAPPSITLTWSTNATTTQYTLYRKLKTDVSWGSILATLASSVTQYVDNAVAVGTSYEYKIVRTGTNYTAYGFINSGIQIPVTENRGIMILVVDSTFITSLAPELKRLENDLDGDGWRVKRIDVLRTGKVTNVKNKILGVYNQDQPNTKALFIFGHVPVPYSGNMNPDGHPDHLGAWPTDSYYGELNGTWTDVSVNSTTASPARTQNVPGDGKFDQSILPTSLELEVGRVDLYNMPTFTLTELQLMKNYLDKDHDYRMKNFTVEKRGVADINFGFMNGEAFGASGYNNMAALVGSTNVINADYFTAMTGTTSYQWSYGCGGGSFSSCSGVGNTANFAAANLQGVFTMLFGSYFGDWDSQNNFLRAPLAQGKMLINSWSGRPHHQYHWMALGETAGYCMKQTMNLQAALYYPNYYGITANWIHNGLMGDPSLRNDVIAPVSNVVATRIGNNCNISWSASTETNIIGYNIYMKNDSNDVYVKLNPSPLTGLTYTDNCLMYQGTYKYMVRTLKLENTPSGTYYNLSQGIADTALNPASQIVYANFLPSANSNTVTFINQTANASVYSWTLEAGATSTVNTPVYSYTANGTYTVKLIAYSNCDSDTIEKIVNITVIGLEDRMSENKIIKLYPNPASSSIFVESPDCQKCKVELISYDGRLIYESETLNKSEKISLNGVTPGLYLLKISDQTGSTTKKLVIE